MSRLSVLWRASLSTLALYTWLGYVPCSAFGEVESDTKPAATSSGDTGPNRDQIRHQLAEMGKKAEEFEKAGKHEDAEQIHHAMRELYTKTFGNQHPNAAGELSPADREMLRSKLAEMGKKAEEFEKAGKHEDAEHLRHAMREIYTKASGNSHPDTRGDMPPADREKVRAKMVALKEYAEAAEKAGKHDQAEKIRHEMQEIAGKLYPQHATTTTSPYAPSSSATVEVRIQKLKAAAEYLHEAGFESEVQHVRQLVERLSAEGAHAGKPGSPTSGYHTGSNYSGAVATTSTGSDFGPMSWLLRDVKNISPEQKEKLSKLVKSYMPRMREASQKASEVATSEQKAAREKVMQEAHAAGKDLRGAYKDAEAAMKLTSEQQAKMKEIHESAESLQKELREKVMDVLTPEQREKLPR